MTGTGARSRTHTTAPAGQGIRGTPCKIVAPAFGAQSPPLTDLLHGQALNQHVMHQRRAVRAEFAFGPVQPQHGLALALGDRFAACPPSTYSRVGSTARGPRSAFSQSLWNARPRLILRLVDLAVRIQAGERIVADRTQGDDLLARLQPQRISTSTVATSALRSRSRDLRSCAMAGLCGFRRLAFGI